jgi:hypothetical protein
VSYHQYNAVSSAESVSISAPKNRSFDRRITGYAQPSSTPVPLNRRYEIAYLDPQGHVGCETRLAPAIPEIENAFCALARGSVVATTEGPVAIEDIVPGMVALTAEGREETMTWIGSMTLFPANAMPGMTPRRLVRVTGDAFGVGRPMPDLILGPSARLLIRGALKQGRRRLGLWAGGELCRRCQRDRGRTGYAGHGLSRHAGTARVAADCRP